MLFLVLLLAIQSPQPSVDGTGQTVSVDSILMRMAEHDSWQNQNLIEYRVEEHYDAKNERFKVRATRDLRTTFHSPDDTKSSVIRKDGSSLIQSQVFDEVVKAESDTSSKEARKKTDITPSNYTFALQGTDTCADRKCYRLSLTPKRKDKFSLEGTVWIDAEDFAIARILGRPAKKPSIWTLRSEIDQHYKRIEGFWMPDFMDTWSDIFIAGHSTFRIDYKDYTLLTPAGSLSPN